MEILIGADPEVFVKNTQTGQFVCAHDMVQGTKKNPQVVEYGAVQVDGMALEFNIDPAKNIEEFVRNVNMVRAKLNELIGLEDYSLEAIATVDFGQKAMDEAPEQAKELGCEPDFNAWLNGYRNPKPDGSSTKRTGAGHIHIGWDNGMDVRDQEHMGNCVNVIKQLDCSLGLQSLSWDADNDRRSLYGNAGAFRPKPYGAEYRVLSNAWLKSEELMRHVYDVTIHSVNDLMAGNVYYEELGDIQDIINEGISGHAKLLSYRLSDTFGVPTIGGAHV